MGCSCSLPLLLHLWPNRFRNEWYIDPGLSWSATCYKWPGGCEQPPSRGGLKVIVLPIPPSRSQPPECDVLIQPRADSRALSTWYNRFLGIFGDVEQMERSFVEGYMACACCIEGIAPVDDQRVREKFEEITRQQRFWKRSSGYIAPTTSWSLPIVGDSLGSTLVVLAAVWWHCIRWDSVSWIALFFA